MRICCQTTAPIPFSMCLLFITTVDLLISPQTYIFLYIVIFFVYTNRENMYLNLFDVHIILYSIRM